MTTSEILMAAWSALETEPEHLRGMFERRVFANSPFHLYAGLVRPNMIVLISMHVPSSVNTDGLERETRGFIVLRQYIASTKTTRVSLELRDASFRELFDVMAQDVTATVLATSDESFAIDALRTRLNHWERFMKLSGPGGLSREDQIGLFGELLFVQTMLANGVPALTALAAWKGPGGANQDFEISGRAVEVKATTGNSASIARVSNELQLDETDTNVLFLMHIWLRQQAGAGSTLPQLVDVLRQTLTDSLGGEFTDRLVQAGYHDVHRTLYEQAGYVERQRRYYIVEGTFPRIRHADLRPSVSRVGYYIDIGGFEEYQRPEGEVIQVLIGESA